MSVRACDAWKEGPRVPRSHARGKKRTAGGGSTRADKKAGKNYFGGSEKRRGREKNIIWAGAKKNIIRAGAKQNSDVNENTTHKKTFTYSRDVFFLPIPLRSRYLLEGATTIRFFLESECRRQKIFFESEMQKEKIHDD